MWPSICRLPKAAPAVEVTLMPHASRNLNDVQWTILNPLIPEPERRKDGRGRPWKNRRAVLNGILWVLRTGAPWADIPESYPPFRPVTVVFSNGFAQE